MIDDSVDPIFPLSVDHTYLCGEDGVELGLMHARSGTCGVTNRYIAFSALSHRRVSTVESDVEEGGLQPLLDNSIFIRFYLLL